MLVQGPESSRVQPMLEKQWQQDLRQLLALYLYSPSACRREMNDGPQSLPFPSRWMQ